MIIGIDGNDANVDRLVGVSVYTRTLLEFFQKKANTDLQFHIFLRTSPNEKMPKETEHFQYKVIKGPILWSKIFLPLYLFLNKRINVFFSPAHYSPSYCPVPLVVTIHDLAYFYFPQEFLKKDLYKLTNWTKRSIKAAKKVIAVSKTTKKDIMHWYNTPEDKIDVVYNGYEKEVDTSSPTTSPLKTFNLTKNKYVFYVGTLQPRKNIPTLIQAFATFKKTHPEYKLVITGKKGWLFENIFTMAEEQKLGDAIVFTDYLPDNEVVELYKNAFCYVLPSLYEGFGIPILEAMSYNCPVISSLTPSLVEVGGDACLYFDPHKPEGLADDLETFASNPNLVKELQQKGKERISAC